MAAEQRRTQDMKDFVPDPNRFDLRTHIWDNQGGLIRKNLYTLYVREGEKYFERPIGSGNLWHENNQPAGRVEVVAGKQSFDYTAEHKAFAPALSGYEKIAQELEFAEARASAAEAELAAIRAERASEMPKAAAPAEAAPLAAAMALPKLRKG